MDIFFALAIAHHLAVFTLVGLFVAELAIVRPGLSAAEVARLSRIDGFYGLLSLAVIAIGVSRVVWGGKGGWYYLENPFFWAKMAAFAAVGLLSIKPTMAFIAWRKRLASEPGWSPGAAEIAAIKPFMSAEVAAFSLVPVFAAAMAQGIGL